MEPQARRFDFVSNRYAQVGEPLNLRGSARVWFAQIFERQPLPSRSLALVLGATPWIARMLRGALDHTTLVDINPKMLDTARAEISSSDDGAAGTVELIEANWLALPALRAPVAIAVGDNSFSFVRHPEEWRQLCNALADRMHPGATLMARFLILPPGRPTTVAEIIEQSLGATDVNYTAMRTAMLFAGASDDTFELYPARAVEMFDAHRTDLAALFERCPCRRTMISSPSSAGEGRAPSYTPRRLRRCSTRSANAFVCVTFTSGRSTWRSTFRWSSRHASSDAHAGRHARPAHAPFRLRRRMTDQRNGRDSR